MFVKFSMIQWSISWKEETIRRQVFSKKERLEPGLKRDPFVDVRMPVKQNCETEKKENFKPKEHTDTS